MDFANYVDAVRITLNAIRERKVHTRIINITELNTMSKQQEKSQPPDANLPVEGGVPLLLKDTLSNTDSKPGRISSNYYENNHQSAPDKVKCPENTTTGE